ncbi:hypothetical protein [Halococcus thailandensis]|uniref:Uncharacterized protein n=1 Tax=Halococcus thailandensis JCM 13552 TaxID=1227457 RepID=M0MTY6_9EURY|nr:hypothetical protein [Halococcus thailandensis]EMA48229.1 hypothetical protein C451_20582 [Halococcus thailandensis JCM 13552]
MSAFDIAAPDDHDALEAIWTDGNDWLLSERISACSNTPNASSASSNQRRREPSRMIDANAPIDEAIRNAIGVQRRITMVPNSIR